MTKSPKEGSRYYVHPLIYQSTVKWCMEYPIWITMRNNLLDTSKGIRYDLAKVQSSGGSDPTSETALKCEKYSAKIEIVEGAVREVAPEIYQYLLDGITLGKKYWELAREGIPCSDKYFYKRRQRVYYLISQRRL